MEVLLSEHLMSESGHHNLNHIVLLEFLTFSQTRNINPSSTPNLPKKYKWYLKKSKLNVLLIESLSNQPLKVRNVKIVGQLS